MRSCALLEYGRLFLQRGRLIFFWSGLFYLQWARPVVSDLLSFNIWGCLWLQWGSLSSYHLSSSLLMARLVSSLGYVICFRGTLSLLLITLLFSWSPCYSLGTFSLLLEALSLLLVALSILLATLPLLSITLYLLLVTLSLSLVTLSLLSDILVSSLGEIVSSLGNLVSFHGTMSLLMVP